MTTVGLLHTAAVHVATFEDLLTSRRPGLRTVHVVDPWLLAAARREGVTTEVRATLEAHVEHLVATGAIAVLVTCSSIGEAVDDLARRLDVPVQRVDRPMAQQAVEIAAAGPDRRVVVLAALESTLGPTGRLVEAAVLDDDVDVDVDVRLVHGAATARDAGDDETADALVARAVEAAAQSADVVVLAQASMAAAARRVDVGVPVLTSPESGVTALLMELDDLRAGRLPSPRDGGP